MHGGTRLLIGTKGYLSRDSQTQPRSLKGNPDKFRDNFKDKLDVKGQFFEAVESGTEIDIVFPSGGKRNPDPYKE